MILISKHFFVLYNSWLSRMQSERIVPNTAAFSSALTAHARESNEEKSFDIVVDKFLRNMQSVQARPSDFTYATIIDGFCKRGKVEDADIFFKRMVQDQLRPCQLVFNSLINGYTCRGDTNAAVECFKKMEKYNVKPDQQNLKVMEIATKIAANPTGRAWFAKKKNYKDHAVLNKM